MSARPTPAEVREWLRVPTTALSDEDLQLVYDGCAADQDARCAWPGTAEEYPPALGLAFLRRCQREVAARNIPLGMVGLDAAEYGPTRLPYLDAVVEEHERPWRIQVLA